MIQVELAGQLRAESLVGELRHLEHQKAARRVGPYFIADAHRTAGSSRRPVDLDLSAFAGVVGQGSRLENAGRAQPTIDPRRIHASAQLSSPWLAREAAQYWLWTAYTERRVSRLRKLSLPSLQVPLFRNKRGPCSARVARWVCPVITMSASERAAVSTAQRWNGQRERSSEIPPRRSSTLASKR